MVPVSSSRCYEPTSSAPTTATKGSGFQRPFVLLWPRMYSTYKFFCCWQSCSLYLTSGRNGPVWTLARVTWQPFMLVPNSSGLAAYIQRRVDRGIECAGFGRGNVLVRQVLPAAGFVR